MATTQKKETQQITGTIPAWLREAVEDYRWENRLTVSEVVRDAFEVWAQTRGVSAPAKSKENK